MRSCGCQGGNVQSREELGCKGLGYLCKHGVEGQAARERAGQALPRQKGTGRTRRVESASTKPLKMLVGFVCGSCLLGFGLQGCSGSNPEA